MDADAARLWNLSVSSDPGHDFVQVMKLFGVRRGRPAHDDDLDFKRARRLDLGVGRMASAVLGHQRLNTLPFHEREFVGKRERTARKDQLVIRQGVDFRRPVDRTHDVAMLRRSRERGELQPALGEENRPSLSPKSHDGVVHGRDLDPAVIGLARPRGAGEHDERRAGRAAGRDRVGGYARSERMGRVDDGVDALSGEKRRQAFGAAEAADALGNRRLGRIDRRPRERQGRRNIGLIGDLPRERARLRGAAENEQAKALQWLAP